MSPSQLINGTECLLKIAEHTFSHTKTLSNGDKVDVVKLVELLKGQATTNVNLTDIRGPTRSKRSGFSQKRYDKVDLDMPGIIDQNNNMIDGRHRYFKRRDQNMSNMDIHVASPEQLNKVKIAILTKLQS